MSLAETYWPLRGVHTMVFVVGGAVGEVVIPLIISRFLGDPYDTSEGAPDGSNPDVLMWTCLGACAVNLLVLAGVLWVGEGMKRREGEMKGRLEEIAGRREVVETAG
jgi:hypothetical protein